MRESNGTDGTGLVEPHFNEAFLNGENSKNTKLGQVYKNVEFPFTQKQIFKDEPGVNYWWYDAAKTSLYLRKDKTTGAYYLGNGNGDGSTVGTLSDNSNNKDSQNKNTQMVMAFSHSTKQLVKMFADTIMAMELNLKFRLH